MSFGSMITQGHGEGAGILSATPPSGLLPHSPSGLSSALLDCCCFVIRVNRPLPLGPHEIGRLHETGQVWNAVLLSLLLWKNPNYQNLAAKMNKKTRWMLKHVCVGRAKILKEGRTDIKKHHAAWKSRLWLWSIFTGKLLSYDWDL